MKDWDRRGLGILDREECLRRIGEVAVGRLGFLREGDLTILPVNHVLHGEDVTFRTTWGSKLQLAANGERVAFEVDNFHLDTESGWSVLVRGRTSIIEDPALREELEQEALESWLPPSANSFWVRVHPEDISGREIVRPQSRTR
ncbi:MAG TPA: pyridoxamine 5'-phosphate oxidase family protein [Segeticoccus sp.]|uniref:pyridoxamine 5'-phosphate oxidase family protein n=1 Tax=Segeticoccus sp. TaxID=2706531 RepID=UPI002D7FF188|nr:pyridoxamine 5'-phosphate oxidase family protein [Segeticoccus sp.]HET8601484.1 pyridoxamine 5'-phosphate oxidase family protein [Segeticoccus sp.]